MHNTSGAALSAKMLTYATTPAKNLNSMKAITIVAFKDTDKNAKKNLRSSDSTNTRIAIEIK